MSQSPTTFTSMVWSNKVICSSCLFWFAQIELAPHGSVRKWVASTYCLHTAKYHFHPSLWSQITIQVSLIHVSNAAVSDMLSGPILESKGMHGIFQKKGKKGKNVKKGQNI